MFFAALTVTGFVTDLLVISAVALLCNYARLPYTIALVGAGLVLGLSRASLATEFQLTPELLFTILLPVLLFEAAIHLDVPAIRRNLRPILLMAVPGMFFTAVVVGFGLHHLLGLSLQASLVFGSLISATDPISVLALFKQIRAPKSLAVVIESESLLNDGAAVVLFNILVAGSSISLAGGIGLFLFESLGGLLVGAGLGWLVWRMTDQIDDHLIEVTLSTILAYGSYLIAQHFHTSGVMAVIAAGLVYGNFALEKMSVNSRLSLGQFWDYLGFLCNSLVFLLIGTQVDLTGLLPALGPICVAFVVVSLARALAIMLLSPFTRLPWRWQVVICWSGLRGSIAMALAMALSLPERDQLLLLTFGVVLLSVFLQGLTVKSLMYKLGIVSQGGPVLAYEGRLGELIANQRALILLDNKLAKYHLSSEIHEEMAGPLKLSVERLKQELDETRDDMVRDEQRRDANNLMLAAQATGLRDALRQGLISEEAYLAVSQRLGCSQTGPEEVVESSGLEN